MKISKMSDNNERDIKRIVWEDESYREFKVDSQKAFMSQEYYGDRDENWIVVYKNDKEVSRINASKVLEIVWMEEK